MPTVSKFAFRSLSLCALVCAAATLTACGGGDDDDEVGATATSVTAAAPTSITVEDVSTNLTAGTAPVVPETDSTGTTTAGSLVLGYSSVDTAHVSVTITYPLGHPEKYVVSAQNRDDDSAFGCISSAWTSAERDELRTALSATLSGGSETPVTAAPLTVCPSSVSFNGTTQLLKLVHTSMPPLAEGSTNTLVLSMEGGMKVPVMSPS